MWIDPPGGWKYGFPKPYLNTANLPLEEWLIKEGYPQHEIDWGAAKHCRFGGCLSKEQLEKLEIHYVVKDDE